MGNRPPGTWGSLGTPTTVPVPKPLGAVEVLAPARLHMGFIDPAGTAAGRRFGSVGMALDQPHTRVLVSAGDSLQVSGAEAPRATRYARALLDHLSMAHRVSVEVVEAMPAHAGLGSGTQLALALGAALAAQAGRPLSAARTASLLDRGGRSGIGVGAFEQGGFLVDGGKAASEGTVEPPPIIARAEVPSAWRVVLVFDQAFRGLSGERERTAFRELAQRSPPGVHEHATLVLMGMLPALAEANLRTFGEAITELQERVGDHFAPAQGGRFASPAVTEALAWMRAREIHGVGQSSWGPTGFGFCADHAQAQHLITQLEARRRPGSGLQFTIATPRNTPARLQPIVSGDGTASDTLAASADH
ncbi:MAG: beta-ribofuranosylaminobenzene 5'-phosphate synthase family protein [Pseudomonadota bacterium]